MTSPSNHDSISNHLKELGFGDVKLIVQYESFRLTPDNQLIFSNGLPDFHPCGHGDLIPVLKHNGMLEDFLSKGGKHIVTVNVDNVLGAPDPLIIGHHIQSKKPVTCEVTEKLKTDSGGILCNFMGFDQIVEQFRLTVPDFHDQFNLINTNSMVIDASLDFDTVKWSWHRVKKNIDNKLVIQHERLLQDLTSTFQTQYIEVPRSYRYMPVKTKNDFQDAAHLLGKNVA